MSTRKLIKNFIFAMFFAAIGCSVQHLETMPPIDVPVSAMNRDIHIFVEEVPSELRLNRPIALAVDVTGDEPVVFPPDFGVKMFRYTDGQWVEVQQAPTEYRGGDIILSPSNGDPLMMGGTAIYPLLPESESPVLLRIFVFGHIYREGEATDEKVGAYMDVVLKP